ncbi:DUF6318 family protein [Paraoerskovia marina]|uniref:DUF6318 family protein n=1 Tax=Paraoerskovia marina TaxID=545619 RepID=UPI0005B92E84|nr:DUF6318 family protein [Paraoerskovia marina]
MRVRRRTLALALPVAVILGLGGCSSDDEPEPGSGVTTSAAPTASEPEPTEPAESPEPEPTETGPTPPPRPAAMDDTGKKGAQAAAKHFIALTEYSAISGDSRSLRAMTYSSTCTTCKAFITEAEEIKSNGYIVSGGKNDLTNITVSDRDQLTGGYAVLAAFNSEEMTISEAGGEAVHVYDGDSGNVQIDVVHDGDDWRVMALVTDQGRAK